MLSSAQDAVRTYVFVIPSKTSSFKSFFKTKMSFASSNKVHVRFDRTGRAMVVERSMVAGPSEKSDGQDLHRLLETRNK